MSPRKLAPLAVSVVALIAVFAVVDLSALHGLALRMRWDQLPLVALLMLAIVLAFGWRWRTLMQEALTMQRSLLVGALGLAGNQVLPLRGGDALRVVLSARGPKAPSLHAGVSAMALEKVFDLIAVAVFGLVSASAFIGTHKGGGQVNVLVIAVAIMAIAAVLLLSARSGLLTKTVRTLAQALRMRPRLYRHMFRPLHHLQQAASPGRITVLLIETAVIWLVLYVLVYLAIAKFVGIPLTVGEAMALLFAGALGLAIPAAPSGLGTYHATIVSAFLLLGRPATEGLVLAVAIHGVLFIGVCVAGAVAFPLTAHKLGPIRVPRESV